MEYKDIPTKADVERIAAFRQPGCVSIYLPTGTTPAEADRARIELKNHLASAVHALEKLQVGRERIRTIQTEGQRILDDRDFWRYQSRSLAVFLDGELAAYGARTETLTVAPGAQYNLKGDAVF